MQRQCSTLMSVDDLRARLARGDDCVVLDCRFELGDANGGWQAYGLAHVPGAHYAHLDTDLSDMGRSGLGRHPLPDPDVFAAILGRWRIRPDSQVICYDAAGGALAAARAWWLLRTIGHRHVAVLDGGWPAWLAAGAPVARDQPVQGRDAYPSAWNAQAFQLDAALLADALEHERIVLLDARAASRFRGETEPLDARAGHVPGAVNRPYADNLQPDGHFKPALELRDAFQRLIGTHAPTQVLHMCGSGVTATHNLLAMEVAGLHGSRLYAPSWSGWLVDARRPVATGD